jgi:predicted dehydrogenase
MATQKPFRIGIIRCDSHAYWYAPFFGEVEPLVLAAYSDDAPTRQSVHAYGCVTNNYQQMAIQPVPGLVVTKVFDRIGDQSPENTDPELLQYGTYPGRAEEFSKTLLSHPQVCHNLEDLFEDIDGVFVADSSSPYDGDDHLELARPFLERGIPCFVDKPFAATFADAKAMVELAKANNTPLMNASLLRHTDVGKLFRKRHAEIGEPGLLVVKGVGFNNSAVGHGISLAHSQFGYGVEAVEAMGAKPEPGRKHWNLASAKYYIEHLLLHYPDGRQAMVMSTSSDWYQSTSEFYCSVFSNQGVLHAPGIGDREFLTGGAAVTKLFIQMIETRTHPVPYEEILEVIAIIEAGRIAQQTGQRTAISEVWDGKG